MYWLTNWIVKFIIFKKKNVVLWQRVWDPLISKHGHCVFEGLPTTPNTLIVLAGGNRAGREYYQIKTAPTHHLLLWGGRGDKKLNEVNMTENASHLKTTHKVFSTSENFLKVWDSTRWNCSNNSKTNLRPRSISKEENKSNKLQRAWHKLSNCSLKFRGQDRHRKAQHREGRRANRYAQRWSLEVLEKRSWNFRSTRLRVQVKNGEGADFVSILTKQRNASFTIK